MEECPNFCSLGSVLHERNDFPVGVKVVLLGMPVIGFSTGTKIFQKTNHPVTFGTLLYQHIFFSRGGSKINQPCGVSGRHIGRALLYYFVSLAR
jgi:hypothetical protein